MFNLEETIPNFSFRNIEKQTAHHKNTAVACEQMSAIVILSIASRNHAILRITIALRAHRANESLLAG